VFIITPLTADKKFLLNIPSKSSSKGCKAKYEIDKTSPPHLLMKMMRKETQIGDEERT